MTLIELADRAEAPDPPFVCDAPPKPKFSMRRMLTDPKLLGEQFAGDSWKLWNVLLIASEGEPLSNEENHIFASVVGRDHVPGQRCDEFWCCVGRRGGKSRAIAAKATMPRCPSI
jgi:hypothetical protein